MNCSTVKINRGVFRLALWVSALLALSFLAFRSWAGWTTNELLDLSTFFQVPANALEINY